MHDTHLPVTVTVTGNTKALNPAAKVVCAGHGPVPQRHAGPDHLERPVPKLGTHP